jgi:hypothetical protein
MAEREWIRIEGNKIAAGPAYQKIPFYNDLSHPSSTPALRMHGAAQVRKISFCTKSFKQYSTF